MKSRKVALLGITIASLLLLSLVLSVQGITLASIEPPAGAGSPPITLNISQPVQPELDPALAGDDDSGNVVEQLFAGLFDVDDETSEARPELATSWDISLDRTIYTFTLRGDATWSDGNPVTAGDVRYGILRSLDPATGAPYAYTLYVIANAQDYNEGNIVDPNLVGVHVLDPTTLRIELREPASHLPTTLAGWVAYPMPQWAIDTHGSDWTMPANIVTSGAYNFAESHPDDVLILEKNHDYFNAANVQIEQVNLWIRDANFAWQMYLDGQLDTVAIPDDEEVDPGLAAEIDWRSGPGTNYLGFSESQPPFGDPLVRKAFSAAIDRPALVTAIYGDARQPALTFTAPDVFGHVDGYVVGVGLPFNPAQAQSWLSDAGYPGGAGLPPVTLWFNEGAGHEELAAYVRDGWYATLGVSATLQSLPWPDYLDFIDTGAAQVWRLGWGADHLDGHSFLADSVYGNQDRFGGWSNASYDALIADAAWELDPATRASLFRQAEEILVETDAIMTPIYYYGSRVATRPYLERTLPPWQYDLANWRVLTDTAIVDVGGGILPSSDGRLVIELPPGALADPAELTLFPISWTPSPGNLVKVGQAYGLHAFTLGGGLAELLPGANAIMTFTYSDDEVSGLAEETAGLYSWSGSEWQREASSVDTEINTVTALVDHFSLFALMAGNNSLNGSVSLQSRTDHSGAQICAWAGAEQIACETSDPAGSYELILPDGVYTVTIEMERFLDAEEPGVTFPGGQVVSMPEVTLLGGDANDSDTVNILDLSLMGARYGMSCGDPEWDARADINNDCTVNILDLSVAGGNYQQSSPVPWITWDFHTIPGLPDNAIPRKLWSDALDNLYVWVEVSHTDPLTRTADLYHWDGVTWNQELSYPGYGQGRIHGNGPDDIFVSVSCVSGDCTGFETPHLAHFDGATWQEQAPPPETGAYIRAMGGAPGEVQAATYGPSKDIIIRYDDFTEQWSHLYTTTENTKALTFISAGEAYFTTCWGHGRWDGDAWDYKHEFDFCDISDIWGIRDGAGDLHLYTVGNNNFSNGIRIWKYTEDANPALLGTFGSKCGFVFGDPDDGPFICSGVQAIGTASGIWGSAADDVYVTGRLGPGADPDSGRIYHYDGSSWSQLTEFGDIPAVTDTWGSGPYDVWFSLQDGRLLHYGS